jgi:hypothetical protein
LFTVDAGGLAGLGAADLGAAGGGATCGGTVSDGFCSSVPDSAGFGEHEQRAKSSSKIGITFMMISPLSILDGAMEVPFRKRRGSLKNQTLPVGKLDAESSPGGETIQFFPVGVQ